MNKLAEEITDAWTAQLNKDEHIGQAQFLVKRSDLIHLVASTIEIMLRRISHGLRGGNS